MHNTISEGMAGGLSVTGGKKDGWGNPDSMARNALHIRDQNPNLSIQDIVDNVLKKQAFGFEGYNPKAIVEDSFPVKTHVHAKAKRRMFCEEASRRADKIPSPSKYQSLLDWDKEPESRTIHFSKDRRRTIAGEIFHVSKFKEKSSPGPTGYSEFNSWRYAQKKNSPNLKQTDNRITFVTEASWKAADAPGFKYPSINLVSIIALNCNNSFSNVPRQLTKKKALLAS